MTAGPEAQHGPGQCGPPEGVRRVVIVERPDYGVAAFIYPDGSWKLINTYNNVVAEGDSGGEESARAWRGAGAR